MAPPVMITNIFVYPVKGCQGISLESALLTPEGRLYLDREFAIVDSRGDRYPAMKSLSMRELPGLASIKTEFITKGHRVIKLVLSNASGSCVTVPVSASPSSSPDDLTIECSGKSTTSAGSWHLGHLPARNMGDEVSEFLSNHLNDPEVDTQKKNKPRSTYLLARALSTRSMAAYAGPNQKPYSADVAEQGRGEASPFKMQSLPVKSEDQLAFADFGSLNIASQSSFRYTQKLIREQDPAPAESEVSAHDIRAFRPNIVIDSDTLLAWHEELFIRWTVKSPDSKRSVPMRRLIGCPRCSVPARNHTTGKFQYSAPKRLRPQDALRKAFPDKLKNEAWGPEWEGTMFGVHCGVEFDEVVGKEESGEGVFLRKGDIISIDEEQKMNFTLCHVLVIVMFLCVIWPAFF